MGTVAVEVVPPTRLLKAFVFADSGSTKTLKLEQLAQNQRSKTPAPLTVSRAHGTQVVAAGQTSLSSEQEGTVRAHECTYTEQTFQASPKISGRNFVLVAILETRERGRLGK